MANAELPEEQSGNGEFVRQDDVFRRWVTDEEDESRFTPERDRYHLYVSLACPWAHRTLITRKLKKLEDVVSVSVVDPLRDEKGWRFTEGPGHGEDPVNGFQYLREAYHATQEDYDARVTVPVLWDKKTRQIVNNSEEDVQRMFNGVFARLGGDECRETPDLCPPDLQEPIQRLNRVVHDYVNNGVYKAGFATRQEAYEKAVHQLFDCLDMLETRLGRTPYLHGDSLTETDINLYVTLVRFDPVYYSHFKCNLRRITDYPNLADYLRGLYRLPAFGGTTNFDHIKRHYYMTHTKLNPSGIVPAGPDLELDAESMGGRPVIL
jgi:putative glutathione S-transferase